MRKYDLVTGVAKKTGIVQADVERILSAAFDSIREAVADDQIVRIKSFGTFSSRLRSARIARNLKGGKANPEPLYVPACKKAFFKPSKNFLNGTPA